MASLGAWPLVPGQRPGHFRLKRVRQALDRKRPWPAIRAICQIARVSLHWLIMKVERSTHMLEDKLRRIIDHNLSVVLKYDPFEKFEGVSDKDSFAKLIGNDPAFAPFFLNNPKYITARKGGDLGAHH